MKIPPPIISPDPMKIVPLRPSTVHRKSPTNEQTIAGRKSEAVLFVKSDYDVPEVQ